MPETKKNIVINLVDKFTRGSESIIASFSKMTTIIGGFATFFVASAVVKIVGGLKQMTQEAEETLAKFNKVFDTMRGEMEEWARQYSKDFSVSIHSTREMAGSLADLLKPMGLTTRRAGELSQSFLKVAADIGSFNNQPTAKVMDDIRAAISGSSETLQKYGTIIREETLALKIKELGLSTLTPRLKQAARVEAIHAMLIQSSTDAMGNHQREIRGLTAKTQKLSEQIKDLSVAIGDKLTPVFHFFIDAGLGAVDVLNKLGKAFTWIGRLIHDTSNEIAQSTNNIYEHEEALRELTADTGEYADMQLHLKNSIKDRIKVLDELAEKEADVHKQQQRRTQSSEMRIGLFFLEKEVELKEKLKELNERIPRSLKEVQTTNAEREKYELQLKHLSVRKQQIKDSGIISDNTQKEIEQFHAMSEVEKEISGLLTSHRNLLEGNIKSQKDLNKTRTESEKEIAELEGELLKSKTEQEKEILKVKQAQTLEVQKQVDLMYKELDARKRTSNLTLGGIGQGIGVGAQHIRRGDQSKFGITPPNN